MDQQDKEFDVSLYLNRITFDQLQRSPSQDEVANTEWEVSDSLEHFSLRAALHDYNVEPTEPTDLELFLHDAELPELQRKVSIRKKIKQLFKHRRGLMTIDEFDEEADRLYKCCLRSCQDLHELHIRRLIGMEILRDIMQRVDIAYVNAVNIMHIIWSIMSCMHHFKMRQKMNTYKLIQKSRQKKLDQCFTIYSQLIDQLSIFSLRLALNAVMTFYTEGKLWDVDFNCTELISRLLSKFPDPEVGFNDIIYFIEVDSVAKPRDSRYMMVVLYEVVNMLEWRRIPPESIDNFIRRLLEMLQCSIDPSPTDIYNYLPLRKGIRMCICNVMQVLWKTRLVKLLHLMLKVISQPDQSSDVQRSFTNLSKIVATEYRKRTSRPFSANGLMPLIFGLFVFENPDLNVIATRIWKSLLDEDNTGHIFKSPRVYFEDALYIIPYCRIYYEDKVFFKSTQRFIFESIVYGVINSTNREILCIYHETIALTMVTVRCSAAASCFVAVGMAVQEYAFTITKTQLVRSHHLHAFVLSIMTLVCYVFHAKIFYKYVISVMQNRAEWAPHLNPPIRQSYSYAAHHILWNRPDLFFEDWEAKYGLWKCFRVKHQDSQNNLNVKRNKRKEK